MCCYMTPVLFESRFANPTFGFLLDNLVDERNYFYLSAFSFHYLTKNDKLNDHFTSFFASSIEKELVSKILPLTDNPQPFFLEESLLSFDTSSFSNADHLSYVLLCESLANDLKYGDFFNKIETHYTRAITSCELDDDILTDIFLLIFDSFASNRKDLRFQIIANNHLYFSLKQKKNS